MTPELSIPGRPTIDELTQFYVARVFNESGNSVEKTADICGRDVKTIRFILASSGLLVTKDKGRKKKWM